MRLAVQEHRSGNLRQAEAIYRQILQVAPDHADAWHLLGVVAYQEGDFERAIEAIGKAIQTRPAVPAFHRNLALALQARGRYAEAASHFQEALHTEPANADTHNSLGNVLQELGRPEEAEAHFREAIRLQPTFAEAFNNLGNVLHDQGRLAEALAAYREALRLRPSYVTALNNLGLTLHTLGKMADAVEQYQHALRLEPDNPSSLNGLGLALRGQALFTDAIAQFQRVLQLPTSAAAYAEAYNHLGIVYRELGHSTEALQHFQQALRLKPDYAEACNNLGAVHQEQGNLTDAVAQFQEAIRLKPRFAEAHNNLGAALHLQGFLPEALACCQQAVDLQPGKAPLYSSYLCVLQYCEDVTPAKLLEAHVEYESRYAVPFRASWQPFDTYRNEEGPLRVGFVSPNFRCHPVGYFLVRLFENLDPEQCETVCYANQIVHDAMTVRLQTAATLWRDVSGLSDEMLAESIRADRIEILFDLAGHTAGNRLLTLARKPAPIQITWLDYEGTTGLSAIDYILADRYEIPPEAEPWYREKVLRMPDGFVCYEPPTEAPAVTPLPALARGFVTFGSFNLPSKITPRTVAAWAKILHQLPRSRLVLKYRGLDDRTASQHFRDLFSRQGIAPERVDLLGWSPYAEFLTCYQEIDVALDPFPYTGGLTTCEALWMGVPVITLVGETFAGRHGLSHLSNVGLTQCIAKDVESYVNTAVDLASDLPNLAELRSTLRQRVAASPLCDGPRFARNFLAMLREVRRVRNKR